MSQLEKQKQKVFYKSPTPKNVKWKDLVNLLKKLGYQEVNPNGGSHTAFYNAELDHMLVALPRPHPGNEVKAYVIERVKKDLEDSGAL